MTARWFMKTEMLNHPSPLKVNIEVSGHPLNNIRQGELEMQLSWRYGSTPALIQKATFVETALRAIARIPTVRLHRLPLLVEGTDDDDAAPAYLNVMLDQYAGAADPEFRFELWTQQLCATLTIPRQDI